MIRKGKNMNTPKIQHVVYMNEYVYPTSWDRYHDVKFYRTVDTVDGSEHWYYLVHPERSKNDYKYPELVNDQYECHKDNSIFVY